MPTLVISDIHGKADRLLALLERYPSHELICLGDAVGWGDNDRVLDLLKHRASLVVLGNHECELLNHYTVSPQHRCWIHSWPHMVARDSELYCHTFLGDEPYRFWDINSFTEAQSMFSSSDFQRAYVGHSHSPGYWSADHTGDRPRWRQASKGEVLYFQDGERYILNPGSLGEPLSTSDPTHLLVKEEFAIWQS